MNKNKIIAIDGPAGSGKSSVAKMVAHRLAILHLDSGAFYRAVTLTFLRNKIARPFNGPKVEDLLRCTEVELRQIGNTLQVYLNSEDVSTEIRLKEVTACVSEVSESALVRKIVTAKLRELAKSESVVMEGRDIGTVVFPKAEVKIFLTATPGERAKRRYLEMAKAGIDADLNEITYAIKKRDKIDSSREIAPLRQADDAFFLDSTGMTMDMVVDSIIREYNKSLNKSD